MNDDDWLDKLKPLDLTLTKVALAEYDRTAPARKAAWDAADTNAAVEAAAASEDAAWRLVSEALATDTSDRNSRHAAMVVTQETVREWVAQFG